MGAKGRAGAVLAPLADFQPKKEAEEKPVTTNREDADVGGSCGPLLEGCVHL
jgi:hypothetical protein